MYFKFSRLNLSSVALLGVLIAILSSCGSDSDSSGDSNTGPADKTDAGVGATVDIDSFQTDSGVVNGVGFAACENTQCDPSLQDCANGDCVLSLGIAVCMDATPGIKSVGQACTDTSECEVGLACFDTKGGKFCERLCCPGYDSCDANEVCGGSVLLADSAEQSSWGYCKSAVFGCDLFDYSNVCEQGEACYITSADGDTQCLREGRADVGETCSSDGLSVQNLCKPGLVCLSSQRCAQLCSLENGGSAPSCSVDTERCVATRFTPEGVGICYSSQPH
ncbi:MAG: hypothetical protein IPJ88_07915 [Myxococcales bacterium]|nr:MAG: hypothetical protein IPJ88_07915 [Myxococcales bacterium]